jgi:uracil-DNA glycosylase
VREQLIQILSDEADWAGHFLILPESVASKTVDNQGSPGNANELERIRRAALGCTACRLSKTRKNVVIGEGNPDAAVMFIGEAPGAVEDETGRPFVGPAGSLLTDIIEKGMGLKRHDVYIANILKCRPPNNRDPQPEEVAVCIGFLHAQIHAVKPQIIVALGRIAAHTLLNDTTPISKLRGKLKDYQGIPMMPTYHPSYLLQNPSKKRETWEDIKKVMKVLGIHLQH